MKSYTRFVILLVAICSFASLSAQTVVLSEDFGSGNLPADWSKAQNTSSAGWEFGTASIVSSAGFNIPATNTTPLACSNDHRYDANGDNFAHEDYLITPPLDLTSFEAAFLEFDYFQPGDRGSIANVKVSVDGGNTWILAKALSSTTAWRNETVNLTPFKVFPNLLIGFHHDDQGNWGDGLAIDNVSVYAPVENAAQISDVALNDILASGPIDITGSFTNTGSANINSLDISYSIDGGAPVTATLTGYNTATGISDNFAHPTPANLSPGMHTINVWASNVNGSGTSNGSPLETTVTVVTEIPVKNVVLEEFTGTWCGWCPDGAVIVENLVSTYPNLAAIAVHSGDVMEFSEGGTLASAFTSSYPSGTIDRTNFGSGLALSRGDWTSTVQSQLQTIVPVSVSIAEAGYEKTTRTLTVKVQADFVGAMDGDFRFNLFMVEDSVVGGSAYSQVNYLNTANGHPYFGAGDPIQGYVHDHTLRAMLGGTWGISSTIPAQVSAGDSYFHIFSYTLPADFRQEKMKIVGVVQEYNSDLNGRRILNSAEMHMPLFATSIDKDAFTPSFSNIYPNPFGDRTAIEFNLPKNSSVNINILDINGRQIANLAQGMMNAGTHTTYWNGRNQQGIKMTTGVYMISIEANGSRAVNKVILR